MTEFKQSPEPFSFDGHGINDADGQRIAKVSINRWLDQKNGFWGAGGMKANPEFERLSKLFAKAPEMAAVANTARQILHDYRHAIADEQYLNVAIHRKRLSKLKADLQAAGFEPLTLPDEA